MEKTLPVPQSPAPGHLDSHRASPQQQEPPVLAKLWGRRRYQRCQGLGFPLPTCSPPTGPRPCKSPASTSIYLDKDLFWAGLVQLWALGEGGGSVPRSCPRETEKGRCVQKGHTDSSSKRERSTLSPELDASPPKAWTALSGPGQPEVKGQKEMLVLSGLSQSCPPPTSAFQQELLWRLKVLPLGRVT